MIRNNPVARISLQNEITVQEVIRTMTTISSCHVCLERILPRDTHRNQRSQDMKNKHCNFLAPGSSMIESGLQIQSCAACYHNQEFALSRILDTETCVEELAMQLLRLQAVWRRRFG